MHTAPPTSHRDRLVALSATSWPHAGRGQVWLLGGSVLVLIGSFLPWITLSGLVTITGLQTAGRWTFYLGFLGLAGALVPWRAAAIVQGAVAGVAAIGLPLWQVLRLSAADVEGWQVGVGLVVCVAGGSLIARAVGRLITDRP